MKITQLETITVAEHPNLLWVQVYTDVGLVGLGETFFSAKAVEAYVHETLAPLVLGQDPRQIDRLNQSISTYLGFRSTGVETRGNSAFDIALWDLFGKLTQQPVAQLLGGFSRNEIRTYNTCAGIEYMKEAKGQRTENYGLAGKKHKYDDLNGFLRRADELAESLLDDGITAMKIWYL